MFSQRIKSNSRQLMLLISCCFLAFHPSIVSGYTYATQYLFGNSATVDGHTGLENISYDYSNDGWLEITSTYARSSCCFASYPPRALIYNAVGGLLNSETYGANTASYRLFTRFGTTDWYTIKYQFSSSSISQSVYPRNSTSSIQTVTILDKDFLKSTKVKLRNTYPPNDNGEYYNDPNYFIHTVPVWIHENGSTTAAYSLPINPSDSTITSWFDHSATSGLMTKYTGNIYPGAESSFNSCGNYHSGAGCYDDHHGIDFGTGGIEGKSVLAAADGVVTAAGWQNPSDYGEGFGYRVRLYHPEYDQSTVYAHATTSTTYVSVNDDISRGDTIALSGNTGQSGGPHLHFGVFEGDNGTPSYTIDPYGWIGTGTSPWINETEEYLWFSDPPSL